MKDKINIGTRGSRLALIQADTVQKAIKNIFPKVETNIVIVHTKGDKILDAPLSRIGDKGLFTRELEERLISKEIDIAVHSLKDMPTLLPEGLEIGAVLKREDPRDVLVSRTGKTLEELPSNSKIATSSLRRRAQILHRFPDFDLVDIRGNLETRIKKMESGYCDGMILAAAGLLRGGYSDKITQYLAPEAMLPAISQGIIGIESRTGDNEVLDILKGLNHEPTMLFALAEREFLGKLEGGCQVPIGCFTSITGTLFRIEGIVSDLQGKRVIREMREGEALMAVKIARELAQSIYDSGGREILKEIQEISRETSPL